MNADGTGKKNLTSNSADGDWDPSVSRDGTRIAFETQRDGGGDDDVAVMTIAGKTQQVLTRSSLGGDDTDADPVFSPDGWFIYFESNRDGGGESEIWRIRASDGTSPTQLTDSPGFTDDRPEPRRALHRLHHRPRGPSGRR